MARHVQVKQDVLLWAHPELLSDVSNVRQDLPTLYKRRPGRRCVQAGQQVTARSNKVKGQGH